MSENTGSEVAMAVHAAIEKALQEVGEDPILCRWALVAETMDQDGQTGTWTLCPDNQPAYASLGLLQYGIAVEQAQVTFERFAATAVDDEEL